ncbi:MAG: 2'-5' RNA ligase family protein [Bacteroidia bacterium]|jgi:2'-5' RNA ligase
MARKRYYIACIPKEPLYNQIFEEQRYLQTAYGLKAMFNSPPHITLHRPFEWEEHKEDVLMQMLGSFKLNAPIDLKLNGYGGFPKRVFYIRVAPCDILNETYFMLRSHVRINLGLTNEFSNAYGFKPHITLAFRDLKPRQYDAIITEFANKVFAATFHVNELSLLKHHTVWTSIYTFGNPNTHSL